MRGWLKELREEKGISQKDVAKKIGFTRQYYNMIENGERRPSAEVAQKIAEILDFEKYGRHWSDLLLRNM